MKEAPLSGSRVVTTRDRQGRLDEALSALGANVVHVPLIEIAEPVDGGAALAADLDDLDAVDWLVVTSRHGATRVGAAVATHRHVRLAAVGARTAEMLAELAGRPVDIVPRRQTAAELVAAMPPAGAGARVLIAQADRAADTLAAGLAARGYRTRTVVAYRTMLRDPTPSERADALAADAVVFASGSAAQAWADMIGIETPPCVIVIGPTTAAVASAAGLQVTHVAADHNVDGLIRAVVTALADDS